MSHQLNPISVSAQPVPPLNFAARYTVLTLVLPGACLNRLTDSQWCNLDFCSSLRGFPLLTSKRLEQCIGQQSSVVPQVGEIPGSDVIGAALPRSHAASLCLTLPHFLVLSHCITLSHSPRSHTASLTQTAARIAAVSGTWLCNLCRCTLCCCNCVLLLASVYDLPTVVLSR